MSLCICACMYMCYILVQYLILRLLEVMYDCIFLLYRTLISVCLAISRLAMNTQWTGSGWVSMMKVHHKKSQRIPGSSERPPLRSAFVTWSMQRSAMIFTASSPAVSRWSVSWRTLESASWCCQTSGARARSASSLSCCAYHMQRTAMRTSAPFPCVLASRRTFVIRETNSPFNANVSCNRELPRWMWAACLLSRMPVVEPLQRPIHLQLAPPLIHLLQRAHRPTILSMQPTTSLLLWRHHLPGLKIDNNPLFRKSSLLDKPLKKKVRGLNDEIVLAWVICGVSEFQAKIS